MLDNILYAAITLTLTASIPQSKAEVLSKAEALSKAETLLGGPSLCEEVELQEGLYLVKVDNSLTIYWVQNESQLCLPGAYTVQGDPVLFFDEKCDNTLDAAKINAGPQEGLYSREDISELELIDNYLSQAQRYVCQNNRRTIEELEEISEKAGGKEK